jgi:hypothetical protein
MLPFWAKDNFSVLFSFLCCVLFSTMFPLEARGEKITTTKAEEAKSTQEIYKNKLRLGGVGVGGGK